MSPQVPHLTARKTLFRCQILLPNMVTNYSCTKVLSDFLSMYFIISCADVILLEILLDIEKKSVSDFPVVKQGLVASGSKIQNQ